jgi:hypothetical protein
MENMYDILEKFNTVADRQTLTEGRAVREDDVEEGNRFTGELAKARAAGKKKADLDGDGDMEPVKEAKKSKPDFLDLDKDGDRKEPMKKAVKDQAKKKSVEETKKAKPDFLDMDGDGDRKEPMKTAIKDRAKKKPVKEHIHVIRQVEFRGRQGRILHDREYDEYQVCVETDQGIRRAFTDNRDSANQLLENLMRERRAGKDKPFFPKPGADDEKTAFRKKFAPSVMRDPAAKGEVERLDRDLERLKKMRRGELDPDEMGDEPPAGEKRGRGRPKKYTADRPRQERVTAKARKADRTAWTPDRKKKKMKEQDMAEDYDQDEYDEEGEMAQSQTSTIADAAMELQDMLTANENLPEWVQKKITLAKEYIDSARDYLKANRPEDSDMAMAEASAGDYSAKKARAGRDIGKPGKQFAKIAKSAGERYGSKERGEKVAGAVLAKLRAKEDVNETDMDESALQAYLGKKKYGKEGMAALQQAGREGAGKEKMAKIRAQHDKLDEEDLEEKAVSKAQRAAAGIAYAAKKRDIPQSELRGASREMARMPAGELKKFAKTKEKGLPEKVKEVDTGEADARKTPPSSKEHKDEVFAKHRERANKERENHDKGSDEKPVKETTTAGSVATAPAEGGTKSKGGIQFGKGVYEARLAEQFEREMQSIMNEGLDVSVTANADGSNTVSVTGKDVAPDVLMDLLQMAGMSGSREEVYQPVQMAPSGADSMSGMLDTLDGIAGGDVDQSEPMIPEATICEVCGGHEGMHEAGCERDMALEADLANSADNTETMSMDYMVDELAGGLNGPKLQSNPNNAGDNPLAMKKLGTHASPNLNLGAIAEEIEQETENRLLDLYRKIGK